MEQLKMSHYNILTQVAETSEWLLYNVLNSGIEILTEEEGIFLSDLSRMESFSPSSYGQFKDVIEYLKSHEYMVDANLDEVQKYSEMYKSKQQQFLHSPEKSITLTVGTTITCNMGCAYCFEFHKPNKSLRDMKVIDAIITYIQDMIDKSPVSKWISLIVTWYGGEPLINKQSILDLTPKLLKLCEENNIEYSARVITNGILLTDSAWQLLKDSHVSTAQITIDGAEETHNISRPLKSSNGENYTQILKNIARKPKEIHVSIRINTDEKIAATMPRFFQDLYDYGIWPQMSQSVNLAPSWLRTYEEAKEGETSGRMTNDEFFNYLQEFRHVKFNLYNQWAALMNLPKAKLSWILPSLKDECNTWVSPYSLVIDPDGNIHKCWETIHEDKKAVTTVFDSYDQKSFVDYMAYDRCELNAICRNCKFLPVCEQLSCSHEVLKHKDAPPATCTPWKMNTAKFLKSQYLELINNPDEMAAPFNSLKENTGHSNR
jgi:uncharacterized protein